MADADGIQFLSIIKRVTPDTIRILFIKKNDPEILKKGLRDCNPFYFITKPCPMETLKEVVEAAINKHKIPYFLRQNETSPNRFSIE